MNNYSVYHRPESEYAYALDANRLRILLRVAMGENVKHVEILYNNKYDFTKRRSVKRMQIVASDGDFNYYGADFVLDDVRFAYIFKFYTDEGIWYYSEDGLTREYDFFYAYYNFFQFPFIHATDVLRVIPWTKNAVFYQIFIDRFCMGNPQKDKSYITQNWQDISVADSFAGGDLKGITQKLPYLHESGVNALYLTPVFRADSNHKYNVIDYLNVDPQFGTNKDLFELLENAHGLGMKVIVDAVFNHCDCKNAYFLDVIEKGKKSAYHDWFMIDGDFPEAEKRNYRYFADCTYMPKWNTDNAAVRKYLIGIAIEYLRMGFDGLRFDVADEISHTLWRELRVAVKTVNSEAVLIGEVWHENTHYLRGDEFDGVMNYRVHKALIDFFCNEKNSAAETANCLTRVYLQNAESANFMMLNFLDNHDTPRFLRLAEGNKDKVLAALCAVFMYPGMPCIFYGTEIPLDGAGDPDCRRTFDWSFAASDERYLAQYKAILALKKQPCVQSGLFYTAGQGDILKIVRETDEERITALFYRGNSFRPIKANGEILYSQNYVECGLTENGVLVYKENKK